MKITSALIWIFSTLYLIVLLILCTIPYWPEALWWMASIFLMAPLWILYIPIGFLFVVALLLKRRRVIILHVLSYLMLVFFIIKFNIPFEFLIKNNRQIGKNIRIMTCNVGGGVDASHLINFIEEVKPDVIVFQEVYEYEQGIIKNIMFDKQWNLEFKENLGIASKLKINDADVKGKRILGGQGGLIGKYKLDGPEGEINIFNIHLETPRKGIEAIIDNRLDGLAEMRKVTEVQDKESAVASRWIPSGQAVIIAGDFNMSEMSPIYKKYWSTFNNAFSKVGIGVGDTKYTGWHGVRIDHILYGNDWKVSHCWVGPNVGSDHRPLIADVVFEGDSVAERKVEEKEKKEFLSRNALIFEDFEISLGKFESYGKANVVVDPEITRHSGNTLQVGSEPESSYATTGVKMELWPIETYPIVSFAYMIPQGTSLSLSVKTIFNDWILLGGTINNCRDNKKIENEICLIDDGRWHEVDIDVRFAIKSILPGLKYLTEFQFFVDNNINRGNTLFWIDDFAVHQKAIYAEKR